MNRATVLTMAIACIAVAIVVIVVTVVVTTNSDDPKPQLQSAVAKATQGYLLGKVTPEAGMFLGIPFSQAPIGEYRWKKPRQPISFDRPYWDATYIRPACIQICNQPAEEYSCPQEFDEDCLYLDLWVPKRLLTTVMEDEIITGEHYVIPEEKQTGDDSALPVMIFLHGGNFLNGGGSAVLYDSRYLADQGNVIGVTSNYRMGPLGFLVQGEGESAAEGNFGIWDQIRTLEWIRDNIKYFGGNPNKVTIYGQSAGAESIGVLMTSPYTKNSGLFHQCIMESNPFGLPFRDYDNAKEYGARFALAAGCLPDDMVCLRKTNTETILQAFQDTFLEVVGVDKLFLIFQPWAPVIEGDFLPEQPIDAFMKGEMLDIPSIIGSTVDEGMLFVAGAFPNPVTNLQYRAVVKAITKDESRQIVNEYPPACRPILPADCDNRYLMNDVASDLLFICPQRAALRNMKSNTWFYFFNETWSFYELWEIPLCFDKVCHAAELPYVFNIANLTIYDYTENENQLADRMGWYWTNFATYGNPNGNVERVESTDSNYDQIVNGEQVGAIYWPQFNENNYSAIQITAEGDFIMVKPYQEKCDFWDGLDSYADHYMMYNIVPNDED